MTIAARESLKIDTSTLDKIIEAANQDIRQCIYSMQMIAAGVMPKTGTQKEISKKDIVVNVFESARQILSKDISLLQKQEMFFSDYSIMPLFVQENYPNVRASRIGNLEHVHMLSQAAELISYGDIIEKQIRSSGAWNLLPDQGMFSCALPATILGGSLTAQINFPGWFGKNSTMSKRQRLMRQLILHTNGKISGSTQTMVSDYLPVLRTRLYKPLIDGNAKE